MQLSELREAYYEKSGQASEVARKLGFAGIALLAVGLSAKTSADLGQALAGFKIDGTLLGLLGLSQAAYVGGKAVAPGPVTELNQKLDQVRELERRFKEAAATAWAATPPPTRDQAHGQTAAPAAYQTYLAAANEAMTMVEQRIGGRHPTARIEPDLP
jgi:hypothetical protein